MNAALVLILVAALALAACSGTGPIANCKRHGGVQSTRTQGSGAVVVTCRDGLVLRWHA